MENLSRQIIDEEPGAALCADRAPKQILNNGERKSIATDRVVLIPGPPDEVQGVLFDHNEGGAVRV